MKHVSLAFACLLAFSGIAHAQEYVHGYTRSNGTYVQGYTRSAPDNTVTNNYSYQGNVNPNNGNVGTNAYTHDATSPNYVGPDANGNVGHADENPYGYR
jgi:hypothetical protein